MKRIIFTLLVAVFTTVLFTNKAVATEKNNEKTIVFNVNMDCHSCVKKIEGNIPYEKGVKDLKVSLDEKECTITFRTDKTTPEALIKAFEKLGYKAEEKSVSKTKEKEIQGHIHN